MLATIPTESIQTVVTSPPFYGLRDYGLPPQIWATNSNCKHEWQSAPPRRSRKADEGKYGGKQATNQGSHYNASGGHFCLHCNAWLGTLGLEPTPQLYIQHLVEIFREVKRVLRKDGTFWLNLGITRAGSGGAHAEHHANPGISNSFKRNGAQRATYNSFKPKDLILIPAMAAIALQADGWYLRSEITLCKRAPMPQPVKDRPTDATEKLYLLSKQKTYYYDSIAAREPSVMKPQNRNTKRSEHPKGDTGRGVHCRPEGGSSYIDRNQWNYWLISPEPLHYKHYATFPTEIPRRAIKAGSRPNDTVLDPFAGSGTTGVVAKELNRNFIGIDLSKDYIEMASKRISTSSSKNNAKN